MTEVLSPLDTFCDGIQKTWVDLSQTGASVENLMENECHTVDEPVNVQLHFNLESQEEFGKLLDCHSVTAEDYTEIFLDTDDNLLMSHNIWVKRVSYLDGQRYSIKFVDLGSARVVTYIELKLETLEDTKKYLIDVLKKHYIQRDELDITKEYSFSVGRYTLTPDKGDYIITIDNTLIGDHMYSVCAIKACIGKDKLDHLFEQVQSEMHQRQLRTITPVLSKILYYLYKKEHQLFKTLTFLEGTNYCLEELTVFNLEYAYDGNSDSVDYYDVYQFLVEESSKPKVP